MQVVRLIGAPHNDLTSIWLHVGLTSIFTRDYAKGLSAMLKMLTGYDRLSGEKKQPNVYAREVTNVDMAPQNETVFYLV